MKVENVLVVGVGQMGSGVAQVCAEQGITVWLKDVSKEIAERAISNIAKLEDRMVEKGKIKESQKKETLSHLKVVEKIEDLKEGISIAFEAVPEKREIKASVHREFDKKTPPESIIAAITSGIPITEMANSVERKDKFIGTHFHHPVPLMKLVEVVPGLRTSEETVNDVIDFCSNTMKKIAVRTKDSPGFITGRLEIVMLNEAIYALMEGLATKGDIDLAMKSAFNHPMGPFELIDMIGLDICLYGLEDLYRGLGEKFRPCPLLRQMVAGGYLGVKTRKGFYEYDEKGKKII
jgi:3-hydroxybutyryl-CoA dehydrogenase